jgi:hypothetical protein
MHHMNTLSSAPIEALHQRKHDGPQEAAWLITLCTDVKVTICAVIEHGSTAYPQANAVIDDFGDLVVVTGWH